MPIWENLATAAMTVTAAALSAIAFMAWHYSRSRKVLLLALGFSLFFIKGLILSIGLFLVPSWGDIFLPASVIIDLGVLLLFYMAVLQRAGA